ncbi:MAG: bifunctional riboflavin kinase/FAD synthetase [Phocaeicola sp.]|uniref:bifunctional riboflavin kinase/FAD synthetase n=1 Tax=Phocaeicola sp. TaxID=2773926 RepID=UPI0023C44124|nr:bifunctional riboflavin kinase/FAD synthetase [Phocaeicola sp.]MDE5677012.1 bifunctional riboflavin kinase/FAD synthetase [Phocaeicola sp.]MDE6181452.1 bifunctional riboflavin kinase/FAD synthetase [Phocaeicola sp.]
MKIISDINHPTIPPSATTIGFFDGVHCGHRFLINQVREAAAKGGLCTALVTFSAHPRQVIQTAYHPQLLSSPTEKLELLETTAADYCILLPFTSELSQLSAREFMQLLRDTFNIRMLVIGYDHRFGHNRSESFEDYCRYGKELDIYIVRARVYTDKGNKISSSAIRQLLERGEVDRAAQYLGYNYHLDGTVVEGHKIGRKIGFPTANLQVDCQDKLIPAGGVYAVYVYVEGKKQAGMLNIGTRPTLDNGKELSIEVNIFHFAQDIYHKNIRIEFVKYLRNEKKYNTIDELIAQMHKDREEAASILL